MSTKTTFKRISLVAIATLGFGMLSVVSASATTATIVATLGTVTPAVPAAGTAVRIPLILEKTVGHATSDDAGTVTYAVTVNAKPNNSDVVAGATSTSFVSDVTGLAAGLATGGMAVTNPSNAILMTLSVANSGDAKSHQYSIRRVWQ